MPTYNFRNKVTGETKTESMKIAEMETFLADNKDWEVDITQSFPAMHSGLGLGLRRPDEGFKDLLGEMKKQHKGGKINDHR